MMRGSRKKMTYQRFKALAEKNLTACISFRETWQSAARDCLCDEVDSAEFERVFFQWLVAGQPPAVYAFIATAANHPVRGNDAPPAAGSEMKS